MTDLSASRHTEYKARNKIRFVTAASLFDGHDAAINIMRHHAPYPAGERL
jgi:methylmalonyl-CoA mutase